MNLHPWAVVASIVAVHFAMSIGIYLVSGVLALRRRYQRLPASPDRGPIDITALKPMCGLDPELEANLESFAQLQAPGKFELLLVLDSERDAAMPVVKKMAAKYPDRVRYVVGRENVPNNKAASVLFGFKHARHPFIWMTDSNVRGSQEHLDSQLATWRHTQRKGPVPALVHAPMGCIEGTGLGSAFDRVQLATFNNQGAEASLWGGIDAVVGKSLFFRLADLSAVDAWKTFEAITGEDFEMGRAYRRKGAVLNSQRATLQVLGEMSMRDFYLRQLRWAGTRKRVSFFTYVVFEPFTLLALGWVWAALGLLPLSVVVGAYAFKLLGDALLVKAFVGPVRPLDIALVPLKDAVVLAGWVAAWFKAEVPWRGSTLALTETPAYRTQDELVLQPEVAGLPTVSRNETSSVSEPQ